MLMDNYFNNFFMTNCKIFDQIFQSSVNGHIKIWFDPSYADWLQQMKFTCQFASLWSHPRSFFLYLYLEFKDKTQTFIPPAVQLQLNSSQGAMGNRAHLLSKTSCIKYNDSDGNATRRLRFDSQSFVRAWHIKLFIRHLSVCKRCVDSQQSEM